MSNAVLPRLVEPLSPELASRQPQAGQRARTTSGWRAKLLATCSLALAASMATLLHHAPSFADAVVNASRAAATPPGRAAESASWQQLSPAQQHILAPLKDRWSTLDDNSRAKWAGVASRYPTLGAAEQARVRERMTQWAKLPAIERGEARLRFQQSRQLPSAERQKQWEAYQALPPEARSALRREGARRDKPIFLGDAVPGPREAKQAYTIKRNPAADHNAHKSNLVPMTTANNTVTASVAPTVVKAGPGATTTLVTERPQPTLHQQAGLPKIAATKGFVDPVTLLPQRGAQSAGMTPAASASGASAAKAAAPHKPQR